MQLKFASIFMVAAAVGVACWWSPVAPTTSTVAEASAIRSAYTEPRAATWGTPESQAETTVSSASVATELDVQLRPASVLPAWAAERNLHADVSAADPSASIKTIACATHFCRVDIARSGPDSSTTFLDKLADQFSDGSAALFRPPEGTAHETVMYFMDTTASLQDGTANVE